MASRDDFSFPTITNNPASHFTIPPTSLWRISSVVYPDRDYNNHEAEEQEDNNQKGDKKIKQEAGSSPSPAESSKKIVSRDDVDVSGQQERMDMLWENFNVNEELKMVSHSLELSNTKKTQHDREDDGEGRRRISSGSSGYSGDREPCCLQALKISSRTTVPKRPNNMVVLLKALKKFFFLHNLAHRTRKT